MKIVIVDDEPKARKLLELIIQENCPEITEIYQAEDLITGVSIIKKVEPAVVFLDIEMPNHSGLEILDFIDKNNYGFEIIFTTAYSEFAIQALQLSAIDYLLKPLSVGKLKSALNRVVKAKGQSDINKKLDLLSKSLTLSSFDKIALPVTDGLRFVNFKDIIMLKANGMYTDFYINSQPKILISKPLKHFSEILSGVSEFYRPHRSYLVNLKFIKEYSKKDGGNIVMENDEMVSISKDKKEEFLSLVNQR